MIGKIETNGKSNKHIVTEALDNIGLKKSNSGYDYFRTAILECLINPGYKNCITQLYEVIAAKYDTTARCVERAIRHNFQIRFSKNEKLPNRDYIAIITDEIALLYETED